MSRSWLREAARDDRALANNILLFLATLGIGWLLAMVLEPGAIQMLDFAADHTTSQAASEGQQYQYWAWSALPFIIVALGAIQLLVASVAEASFT